MSSLGVGITAAVNAKSLFMIFFIICRQCLFSLPIYFEPECCSCTLWRSTQETCMACEYVWGHHVLWGCVGVPWACEDVCDCGLCVKTVELVRIITAYLQMHLPWFLPNAQTRWLLTTMITHTTRNIAATKYWIRPIFFKTDHALPSEAWMMMKCQWKYQNCRSLQRHVFFV